MKSNDSKFGVVLFIITTFYILFVHLAPNTPVIFLILKFIFCILLILFNLVGRDIMNQKERLFKDKERIEMVLRVLSSQYEHEIIDQIEYERETGKLEKQLSEIEEKIRKKKYIG